MTTPLRVLIVEDSEDDAELLLRNLCRGGFDPVHERVETPGTMRAALERPWDVIISDWAMPHFSAEAALAVLKDTNVDLPFIIVSGTVGEEAAVTAMLAGAHDFMAKGRTPRLIPAIHREMREAAGRAERRIIEHQLRQTQKMEAMGQLTGGIAHDFNNLLGVIVANADLLLDLVNGDAQQAELANEILASGMHGAELTHRLLAFARQQPLSPQIIALNEHLPRIITILGRTLGETISVTTLPAEALWETRVDPSQIEDALLNLAINARDAMPSGGVLTIETANTQLDEHYAELHPEVSSGDYVMLAMTDTGTGMAPEIIERVLEPFFTTKEFGKGTGLGLSMVYGFAKQSGGHLSIYSEVGVGTTIRLYLPRAYGEAPAEPAAAEPGRALPTSGERILLVDDNAALRRVTLRRLTGLGYRVEEAEDGPAALALLDAGNRFDLLFTDIGLPGGINGFELATRARQRQSDLNVLFTTGYGNNEAQSGQEAGSMQHLIRKPYRSDELASALRTALADAVIGEPT
ncbi:MAG TPA: response regulator [Stellaceae bacterium]|jgi:signal transduction histidine kinase|nr:response regulator [Stellaceae bacterium]